MRPTATRNFWPVTSAFRRSAVRGPDCSGRFSAWFNVTSAFRRSAVRGQRNRSPGRRCRRRHQCLSAECCSRTNRQAGASPFGRWVVTSAFRRSAVRGRRFSAWFNAAGEMSPVPFGGVLFADGRAMKRIDRPWLRHQCLSAECCSRTNRGQRCPLGFPARHQCLSAECCSRTVASELAGGQACGGRPGRHAGFWILARGAGRRSGT